MHCKPVKACFSGGVFDRRAGQARRLSYDFLHTAHFPLPTFPPAALCNQLAGFLLVCLGVVVVGCGGRDPNLPELVPVSGTVTMDGRPLSGAWLSFVPVGSTRGRGARAASDKDGKYELISRSGEPGAPVGEYRVVILKMVMPDGSDFPMDSGLSPIDSPAEQVLPERYSSDTQSTLKATVPAGGSSSIDFALTSEP